MSEKQEQYEKIATLIREHGDLAANEFQRLLREVGSMRREIHMLRQIIAMGDQHMFFPWFKLSPVRSRMVEKVLEYLRRHRGVTIPRACQATFELVPGGYPNAASLSAYCYSIKLEMFISPAEGMRDEG